MNTQDLCKATGLTPRKVEDWLESGLIEPIPGWRREFGDNQIERVALAVPCRRRASSSPSWPAGTCPFPARGSLSSMATNCTAARMRRRRRRGSARQALVLRGRSGLDPQGVRGISTACLNQVRCRRKSLCPVACGMMKRCTVSPRRG
jgi:hypothetical protein